MKIYPKQTTFTPCPEGLHVAVCKYVGKKLIDSKFGKASMMRFVFQIDEEVPGRGQRFQIQRLYSQKMSKSGKQIAHLRRDLESWRGRAYTDEEENRWPIEGFDFDAVEGHGCQINVLHKNENGNIYANISGIMPLPKGVTDPPFALDWYDGEMDRWVADTLEAEAWENSQSGAPADHGDDNEPTPF